MDNQAGAPAQMAFSYAAEIRITKHQYAYAAIRGRLPVAFPDWQCKVLADGGCEADFKATTVRQRRALCTVTARWNARPAVQVQIEYERARAIETRLAEPLRAWEAKMAKLHALAAGELPMTRTVAIVDKEEGRQLLVEEFFGTNLTAMAKALEMEGRALAVFKDKAEISGPDGAAAIQVLFVKPEKGYREAPESLDAPAESLNQGQ
ncbi:MAG: hypothetical protein KAX46_04165 [Chromatiaceae bacterium]|nr:hypothetical protein [Chromatiaceae bacterium]